MISASFDDSSSSYSLDDFVSNGEDSSSVHEFQSKPNIPLNESAVTASTHSHDGATSLRSLPKKMTMTRQDEGSYSNKYSCSNFDGSPLIQKLGSIPNAEMSESDDDGYSMDTDFVRSSKEECSDEDHVSTHHGEASTFDAPHTQVKELHPQQLEIVSRYHRDESSGLCDAKESSLCSQKESEPDYDTGYIGEVKSTTYETVSAPAQPHVDLPMMHSTNAKTPVNEKPKANSQQQQCRVSFDPICVFIATKKPEGRKADAEKSQNVRQYSKKRLNELSQPVKHNIFNTPEKMDKPKKKSPKASEEGQSFLERMKTMENEKREKLQRAAAEAIYNAKLDKNSCRNCGTTQTYDEMINGKKYCKNELCRKGKHQYLPPKKFKLKTFESRMEKSALRRRVSIAKIEEEKRASFTVAMPKRNRRQQTLIEKVSVDDFFTRMAKDIRARKEKLIRLEHSLKLEKEKRSFIPKSDKYNVKVAPAGTGSTKTKKK